MAIAASDANQIEASGFVVNDRKLELLTRSELVAGFQAVRKWTEHLAASLSAEDQNLQSMPGASPVKWHRAHTSWFFETFILGQHAVGYRPFNQNFAYLYNSYYNGIGEQYPRAQRALISRPDGEEIGAYRQHVDSAMLSLIENLDPKHLARLAPLIVLGLNHEQQHQELIVTDLKHAFSHNPMDPQWTETAEVSSTAVDLDWIGCEGGLVDLGSAADRFCFDNETPRHRCWLDPYQLANRPVSCGDFLAFIEDDGYHRPELWLADGWDWCQRENIEAPLYWSKQQQEWTLYSLGGRRALDPNEALCHISFYEAAAYAQWAHARLPTEAEWEHAAARQPVAGHFADGQRFHPKAASGPGLVQLFGDVWEWTASSYAPFPGFKPPAGAVGEYNGKFMANQIVLRGGSCATPTGHVRASYRNFFYPQDRWQFSGLRLARDADQ